jgi:hypothetical protein
LFERFIYPNFTAQKGHGQIHWSAVRGGRNAIKFKGPEAAEYLAVHEDSERRVAEFRQSAEYQYISDMCAEAALADGCNFDLTNICTVQHSFGH